MGIQGEGVEGKRGLGKGIEEGRGVAVAVWMYIEMMSGMDQCYEVSWTKAIRLGFLLQHH